MFVTHNMEYSWTSKQSGTNFEQVEPTCSFVHITAENIRHFNSAKETGPS